MTGQARRVLVTGGAGFLGRGVVHALVETSDAEVTVLSRHPLNTATATIQADLRDAAQTRRALDGRRFDAVCHLAALTRARESVTDPLGFWTTNVTGTINLLAALQPGTPVVLASTAAVYTGDAEGALDEDTPIRPANPYGASKYAAEQVCGAWSIATNSPVTILRCFNIAGAVDGIGDEDPGRIIPALIKTALGTTSTFTVNGDGTTTRDYTHVLDVAAAFVQATQAEPDEPCRVLNVGSGTGLSVAQLLDAMRVVTGRDVPARHAPPRQEATRLVADSRRIVTELGWVPTRSTAENIIRDAWQVATAGH
jgi:UDP-glucose 4-epimerase